MPDARAPEIRYARADGLHLAYWEVGDAPRVFMLVLPWLSQVEVAWEDAGFAKLVERLEPHGRVVAFDRRGAGLSDPMERPATLEERAEDLTAVLDAVGAQRASLLCLNEGGSMAMVYAAAHPERVDALVLYGAYAAPTRSDELWWAPGPESYDLTAQFVEEHWGTGRPPRRLGAESRRRRGLPRLAGQAGARRRLAAPRGGAGAPHGCHRRDRDPAPGQRAHARPAPR